MSERVSKTNYYLDIAETVSERSTCLRKHYGAIIAASRDQMLGATLYMACTDPKDGSIVAGTCSCAMCKRTVINAGIETVVIRDTKTEYRTISVSDWIENDDSLDGTFGY